jgi:hypothetical protein
MKKTLVLAFSITFLGSSFSIPAFGAVKPGASCTKSGSTSTTSGKKFTCIKSGKKLVWDKGVPVTKPANDPGALPLPSPSPSQTASPTPIQTPVGLWQETQFKILEQFKGLKPAKVQVLNFVYSPNVDKIIAKQLQDSYQEPISYLSNLYVNPAPVTFLLMNENDKDWWIEKFKQLSPGMNTDWWGSVHCVVSPKAHCGYGSSPNPDGSFHFGQLLGSEVSWVDRDYTIAFHESIHVYQLGLMGNRMSELPSWFAEGQANYLGYTFSHRYVNSKQQRNMEMVRLKSWPSVENFDDKQWLDWIQKIESDRAYTFEGQLGYSVGELILESLYNQYDFRKVHDWMVAIKNGSDYKTGFKSTFGQDYDSWLRDTAAPYLNSQI